MNQNTALAENLLKNELEGYERTADISRNSYLGFVRPLLDENGELNPESLTPEQLKQIDNLSLDSENRAIMVSTIKDYINENSSVGSLGLNVRTTEERLQDYEKKEFVANYDENSLDRTVKVCGVSYVNPTKTTSLREFRDFYLGALNEQMARVIGVAVGTPEFTAALDKICSDIVKKQRGNSQEQLNSEQLASQMVEQMAQGVDVLGENTNEMVQSDGKTMGFTVPWVLGLVTGIVIAAIVIFGIVLIK